MFVLNSDELVSYLSSEFAFGSLRDAWFLLEDQVLYIKSYILVRWTVPLLLHRY